LIRGTIDTQTPARLFAYHVADGAPRRVWLVLRSAVPTHVQMLGTISGASRRSRTSASNPVRVFGRARQRRERDPPHRRGMPYVIPFGLMQPGDLIEAVEDLRWLTADRSTSRLRRVPRRRRFRARRRRTSRRFPRRRGVFTLTAVAPIDLAFTSGAAEPAPVSIVMPRYRTSARANVRSAATTASCARSRCILQIRPRPAKRLSLRAYQRRGRRDGDALVYRRYHGDAVPCVDDSAQPHLIRAFTLSPSETRTVTGSFMTDGSASYPVRFA